MEEPTPFDSPPARAPTHKPSRVNIKYRRAAVDLAHPRFEFVATRSSSFVRGAWYDRKHRYMVIRLRRTFYHYCGMPPRAWQRFRHSRSFGQAYNYGIKGRYDCRRGHVPRY